MRLNGLLDDIAKAALDVFIGSGGVAFSVTNDDVGIRELLRHLAPGDFAILEVTQNDPKPEN